MYQGSSSKRQRGWSGCSFTAQQQCT